MKKAHVLTILALSLCLAAAAPAQRALDATEIQPILEQLTSRQQTTWIPAGTIEARREEFRPPQTANAAEISSAIAEQIRNYQADTDKVEKTAELQKMRLDATPFNVRYELANEYTMTSQVVVRYDGDRFYWEINVESRSDSIKPDANLQGNFMAKWFDVNWNGRRIFAWDGENYTTYTVSGGNAMVDSTDTIPRSINGPLTAGYIPWGYGNFTYKNLSEAKVTATEVSRDGETQIDMTVVPSDGSLMSFSLIPAKDYAVATCTIPRRGDTIQSHYCSGYRKIGSTWVPATVLVERRDALSNNLLRSDKWDFTSVDVTVPGPEAFTVEFLANTRVEYRSLLSDTSAVYQYSNLADTDRLLADRLGYVATKSKQPQNCATAALQYLASEFGKTVARSALDAMVGPDGQTTMAALKQTAEGMGLYCRAVRTDIATLRDLGACKAVLHLPAQNHFVVLDHVDDRNAWIIDLSKNKFYYRRNVDFLPTDWSEGTALLVSDQPIAGAFDELSRSALSTLVGGDGWDCTRLLQIFRLWLCEPMPYGCEGYYTVWFKRLGCDPAPTGTCETKMMVRIQEAICLSDLEGHCSIGDWFFYYMRACGPDY